MAQRCELCGKGPVAGRTYARRGKPKKQGGVGRRITGKSRRRFMPNLRPVRTLIGGRLKRILVCTKCLKKGSLPFGKAQPPAAPALVA